MVAGGGPSDHLLMYLCCAVGSAVPCSAGGRGGGEGGPAVALSPCGRGQAAIHRHWAGRQGSHAAHTSRHSSQSGAGLRALGPRGLSGGAERSGTRWTPVTAVTSRDRRKVCTPSCAAGAGRGGRSTGAAPYRCVGLIPRTRSGSPRVATTRRCRGVPGHSCQRICRLWWAPLVLERKGDRCGLAQPRGACVAGRRAGHQAGSLGNAPHTTAYGGVGLVPSYTGLVGRGRVGASTAPSTKTMTSPSFRSSSSGCRMWSAASSSDTPPGYIARAWFRYGAVSPGQCVLRACSRAGAASKQSDSRDRGLISSLPIPYCANSLLYVDFIHGLPRFGGYDSCLVVNRGLSRFTPVFPCNKKITGEQTVKMLVEQRFQPYGAAKQVHSDEDVRIRSDTAWYKRVENSLNMEVTTGVPYTDMSNPLCERQNRVVEQNLRILMKQERTRDWVRLVSWAVLTMNSQRSSSTGFIPHELFHGGRRACFFKTPFPEDFKTPVGDWLEHKQSMANQAWTNLRHILDREPSWRNRLWRPTSFNVGDLVLVHHSRLPSWPRNFLQDPYFGPYRIIRIDGSRIHVRCSPRVGAELLCAI